MPYASVVVNLPVDTAFHYRVPDALRDALRVGHRVRIPFRDRTLVGTCVGFADATDVPADRVRDVIEIVDPEPLVSPGLLELARWMAGYYYCSWGEALEALLPAPVRKRRAQRMVAVLEPALPPEALAARRAELVGRREKMGRAFDVLTRAREEPLTFAELCRQAHVTRGPILRLLAEGLARRRWIAAAPEEALDAPAVSTGPPAELTPDQAKALSAFRALRPLGWDDGGGAAARQADPSRPRCLLLHGVTGSGKTEVYLRAIAETIAAGRQAIMLVPEIALTPQTVARFRARFPRCAVLHSVLAESDRAAQWRAIRSGAIDVVVGARSALFAPLPRLGLIVIDEEHETGYKQESDPRYHAREAGIRRAELEDAVVLLGSATPALETYHAARTGRFVLAALPERVGGLSMPPIDLVDLAQELKERKGFPVISRRLEAEIRETLARREQALLFLNRRGFATLVHCPSCRWVLRCARCNIAMTYHRRAGTAMCHYCFAMVQPPDACPDCARPAPRAAGMGTERVEDAVRAVVPEARVARMDSDTMRSRRDYRKAFGDLASGATDVLVGTQMIAKGFDIPNVTLVGVVSADTAFWLPDFRSAERTFQLIMQVAGRAGRGPKGGRVVVQTYNPQHYSIVHAVQHDYEGFAARELEERKALDYPPFSRLVRIVCQGMAHDRTRAAAEGVKADLAQALREDTGQILGPVPAPLARLRGRHRLQMLIKTKHLEFVQHELRKAKSLAHPPKNISVVVDVDPMGML